MYVYIYYYISLLLLLYSIYIIKHICMYIYLYLLTLSYLQRYYPIVIEMLPLFIQYYTVLSRYRDMFLFTLQSKPCRPSRDSQGLCSALQPALYLYGSPSFLGRRLFINMFFIFVFYYYTYIRYMLWWFIKRRSVASSIRFIQCSLCCIICYYYW